MGFWILAVALAAAVALIIALAILRGQGRDGVDAPDLDIYRDQLAAVDRDLARGTATEDEAERLRTEIKRRLLDADRARSADRPVRQAPAALNGAAAVVAVVAVVGGSVGIYALIGAPGYPDLPRAARLEAAAEARASRPSQEAAEASVPALPPAGAPPEFMALMERLRAAVAERPDDLQGQTLLARNEASLGNFAAARAAQERILAIKGDAVTAQDLADYGDLLVLAAGGYVSPQAERAFEAALARDPSNGVALYYLGAMHLQTGRPDTAFNIWERQLRAGPADAPWIAPIRAQIGEAARRAGIDYAPPPVTAPAPGGPSQADIAAAGDMSAADRMVMIEGMVSGLSERLATEGGPPEDWARLIRAYGVLGRQDAAAAIWAEAQQVFPDDFNRVQILQAARDAGVAQ